MGQAPRRERPHVRADIPARYGCHLRHLAQTHAAARSSRALGPGTDRGKRGAIVGLRESERLHVHVPPDPEDHAQALLSARHSEGAWTLTTPAPFPYPSRPTWSTTR